VDSAGNSACNSLDNQAARVRMMTTTVCVLSLGVALCKTRTVIIFVGEALCMTSHRHFFVRTTKEKKRRIAIMKLIASLTTPYGRKVRIVLAEKHLDAEYMDENVWAAETKVPLYNPLGKVPVLLLDDGTALYDSRVIVEYLDGVVPVSRLIPESGRERALVRRWEALGDGIADAGIAVFLERKRPAETQGKDWITRQFGKIEAGIAFAARELGDRKFCQGETFTLGDISLACALLWLEFRLPEVKWRETYPNLRAWIERVETRKEFVETQPPK
jgi:glutathione S-transferase